ncbi:hypothetical protein [Gimesia algae]|uniref:Uncharacterized protein n=1 Tax=Gimesia algae TaxID=2527971 RepID=A0A517V9Z0_9PLAN|nr:hypothetical protein [Gimesia algae]QDT89815.1 hypothetical protein Pan161_14480 [Gimesia algae]
MYKMDREIVGVVGHGVPQSPLIWGFSAELTTDDFRLIHEIVNQSGAMQFQIFIQGAVDVIADLAAFLDEAGQAVNPNTIIYRADIGKLKSETVNTLLREVWKANYACQMWIIGGSDSDINALTSILKSSSAALISTASSDAAELSNQAFAIRMGYDGLCLVIDLWKGKAAHDEHMNLARMLGIEMS